MTVYELIEELKKQNPLNHVFASHYCSERDEQIIEEIVEDVLEGSAGPIPITILRVFI